MTSFRMIRALATLLIGLSCGGIAALLGATIEPAMFCGAVGAAGCWAALHYRQRFAAPPAMASTPPLASASGPDVTDLIETIDDPILIVSRQIVTHANRAALAVLGAHIVGEDVRVAIRHPAAADRLAGRDMHSGGRIELVGLGDRERRWELVVRPIADLGLLVRLADRTGAYAAERMRVDFVANASHELRTPLSTLIGFIETLEDSNAAEDAATRARFLGIMAGEAKRMQQLVNDLISLSRIEAEKYSAPQTALALAPLIAEVRASRHTGIIDSAERIQVEVDPGTPMVAGDRAQLSQLLHNVIGNALKYARADTPVRVSARPDGAMVRLSVADEGDGIPPEHLARLTERFYRVEPSRSRALGGTGLGLSIVKHIVERHRGHLAIDSVVGRGTIVSVLLPGAPETLSQKSHISVTQTTPNDPSDRPDPA